MHFGCVCAANPKKKFTSLHMAIDYEVDELRGKTNPFIHHALILFFACIYTHVPNKSMFQKRKKRQSSRRND